jgi:hypothetical protein
MLQEYTSDHYGVLKEIFRGYKMETEQTIHRMQLETKFWYELLPTYTDTLIMSPRNVKWKKHLTTRSFFIVVPCGAPHLAALYL